MSTPMEGFPEPGQRIGPYEVVRQLGMGGMGVVFEAVDTVLNRRVALKVISPYLANDPAFRVRFTQEAQAQASLDSPHVVQVFAHGEADGSLYIASQLIPDGDLGQMIRSSGAPPPGIALDLIAQISAGLADAHASGLVHRDIKPANVLLRIRGQEVSAYLADFGIARRTDLDPNLHQTMSTEGFVVGTPSYMAPELHTGGTARDGHRRLLAGLPALGGAGRPGAVRRHDATTSSSQPTCRHRSRSSRPRGSSSARSTGSCAPPWPSPWASATRGRRDARRPPRVLQRSTRRPPSSRARASRRRPLRHRTPVAGGPAVRRLAARHRSSAVRARARGHNAAIGVGPVFARSCIGIVGECRRSASSDDGTPDRAPAADTSTGPTGRETGSPQTNGLRPTTSPPRSRRRRLRRIDAECTARRLVMRSASRACRSKGLLDEDLDFVGRHRSVAATRRSSPTSSRSASDASSSRSASRVQRVAGQLF